MFQDQSNISYFDSCLKHETDLFRHPGDHIHQTTQALASPQRTEKRCARFVESSHLLGEISVAKTIEDQFLRRNWRHLPYAMRFKLPKDSAPHRCCCMRLSSCCSSSPSSPSPPTSSYHHPTHHLTILVPSSTSSSSSSSSSPSSSASIIIIYNCHLKDQACLIR